MCTHSLLDDGLDLSEQPTVTAGHRSGYGHQADRQQHPMHDLNHDEGFLGRLLRLLQKQPVQLSIAIGLKCRPIWSIQTFLVT